MLTVQLFRKLEDSHLLIIFALPCSTSPHSQNKSIKGIGFFFKEQPLDLVKGLYKSQHTINQYSNSRKCSSPQSQKFLEPSQINSFLAPFSMQSSAKQPCQITCTTHSVNSENGRCLAQVCHNWSVCIDGRTPQPRGSRLEARLVPAALTSDEEDIMRVHGSPTTSQEVNGTSSSWILKHHPRLLGCFPPTLPPNFPHRAAHSPTRGQAISCY